MSRIYTVAMTFPKDDQPKYVGTDLQTKPELAERWKNWIKKARTDNAAIRCCCPGTGKKRLSAKQRDDTFFLAKYSNTGYQHSQDCQFYAPDPMRSGQSCYQQGVIEEAPDGSVRIRLAIGLTERQREANGVAPQPAGRGRASQPAMRLLGLLHHLWSESDLNIWRPGMEGKRDLNLVTWCLERTAEAVVCSRLRLNSVLLLAATNPNGEVAKRNRERVEAAANRNHRLLVIAPLARFSTDQTAEAVAERLRVTAFGGIPSLYLERGLWDKTKRRYPRAISAWQHGHTVVAIAEVTPKKGKHYAQVIDLALMPVTKRWIPFDSMYEQRIAEKLAEEGRAFNKPLRFDAEDDVVFPDFILLDTKPHAPMEVFGRSDEAYQARKAVKEAYYSKIYQTTGWWSWNAVEDPDGQNIPAFPSATSRSAL